MQGRESNESISIPVIESRKNRLLVIFSAVFVGSMLTFLFIAVDKRQLVEIAGASRPLHLIVAFGLFLLSIFLYGVRFRFMINGSSSYFTWWRIATLHQFFFTFVPFRLGELSYFPLASKLSHGEFRSSLPVLLSSRLYDFLMLALLSIAAVLGLQIPGYTVTFLLIAAIFFIAAANTKFLFVVSQAIFEKLHVLLKLEAFRKISQHLDDAHAWYSLNEKSKYTILVVTFFAWLTAALGFYFIFKGFSVELDAYRVLFLFAGTTFIGVLAFFSVGGIGVSELGLAGLLIVLGFDAHYALALSILTRLTMLSMTLAATFLMELATWIQK